jgi:RimJ/RimL family protein N-acetyltransferase
VPRPSDTARLAFTEIGPADLDDLAALLGDPRVMAYDPPPMTREEVREWIEENQVSYVDPGFGLWALRLSSTGEFVGDCGLALQDVEDEIAVEIEFHIRVEMHGRGYATEAASACRDFAATSLKLRRLIGIIAPDNTACHRVVEKIGFCREKVVRHEGGTSILFSADPLGAYLNSGQSAPREDPTGNSA